MGFEQRVEVDQSLDDLKVHVSGFRLGLHFEKKGVEVNYVRNV